MRFHYLSQQQCLQLLDAVTEGRDVEWGDTQALADVLVASYRAWAESSNGEPFDSEFDLSWWLTRHWRRLYADQVSACKWTDSVNQSGSQDKGYGESPPLPLHEFVPAVVVDFLSALGRFCEGKPHEVWLTLWRVCAGCMRRGQPVPIEESAPSTAPFVASDASLSARVGHDCGVAFSAAQLPGACIHFVWLVSPSGVGGSSLDGSRSLELVWWRVPTDRCRDVVRHSRHTTVRCCAVL